MTRGYIDVHHHIIPALYKQALADFGIVKSGGLPIRNWTPDMSLEHMNILGVEKAYCSLSEPAIYPIVYQDQQAGRQVARRLNEYMAQLCKDYPNNFGAFAVLPLPDVEGAIEEAKYALDTLKLDGVGMLSNYQQEFLGNKTFDRLFDVLEERHAIIYIHPSAPPSENIFKRPEFIPFDYFEEFCFNTNRAATNLVLSGTLERCPHIKPILSHMGGTLPFLAWRLNSCFNSAKKREATNPTLPDSIQSAWSQLNKPLYDYFGRFYFDCALSSHPVAFNAVETLASTHILFGSDAFYATLETAQKFVRGAEEYYHGEALNRIKYGNAETLFNLK